MWPTRPIYLCAEDVLGSQWVVRDKRFPPPLAAQSKRSNIRMRRTFAHSNDAKIGDADIFVGDPNVHFAATNGQFEFATCHHHFHFRHYALYQLINPATGKIWRAAKRGFCMLDTDPNPVPVGGVPPRSGKFRNCSAIDIPGNQGISAGWADTYPFTLAGHISYSTAATGKIQCRLGLRNPHHGQPTVRRRKR